MESLINPKEKYYFIICVIASMIIYLLLVTSVVGLIYIAIGVAIGNVIHGVFIGHLKGNAIRVTEKQFPEVYHLTQTLAKEMDLKTMPAVYVLQAGGTLNAFATRFLSRDFVVIYSDILELAYEQGEAALAFVICHELAHIKRKHPTKHLLIYPALSLPFLGSAYSRACEFTCDRFGAYYRPDGAAQGLLVLAAGKKLYQRVDMQEYVLSAERERGFWVWLSQISSTHPHLFQRLNAVSKAAGDESAIKQSDYLEPQPENI